MEKAICLMCIALHNMLEAYWLSPTSATTKLQKALRAYVAENGRDLAAQLRGD